jgi:hypothetical protein
MCRAPTSGLIVCSALLASSTWTLTANAQSAGAIDRGIYVHTFGGLRLGRGLRFNNPFRLETELGDSPESLSLTAPYLDLHAGAALGNPQGLEHGLDVHLSLALSGVRQEVLTPSYAVLFPIFRRWLLIGRLGAPVILEPDLNVGAEVSAGAVSFVSARVGVSAALVYSLFYGAATWERTRSPIPVLSAELGVWIDYEVLP